MYNYIYIYMYNYIYNCTIIYIYIYISHIIRIFSPPQNKLMINFEPSFICYFIGKKTHW